MTPWKNLEVPLVPSLPGRTELNTLDITPDHDGPGDGTRALAKTDTDGVGTDSCRSPN